MKIAREAEIFSQYISGVNYAAMQALSFKPDLVLINNILILIVADYNYIVTSKKIPVPIAIPMQ